MKIFKIRCIKSIYPTVYKSFEKNKYYFCYAEKTTNAYWVFFNEYNSDSGYRFYKNDGKNLFDDHFIGIKKDRKLKLNKINYESL